MGLKTIKLDKYSKDWPRLFEEEKQKIISVIGDLRVEHMGSTAIPGLDSKPVIDMMAAVNNLNAVKKYIESLETLEYKYAPELEQQTPDRKFFQKRTPNLWYHLSLTEPTSIYWRDHILFRDYLRNNSEARKNYEELKIRLAEEFVDDFDKYNSGKTEFINKIIEKALKENSI